MKKILLITIAFIAISTSLKAGDGFYWGPKIGIGISNLSGKINSSFRGGFDAGLAIGYDAGRIGLEVAAIFKSSGATMATNFEDKYGISTNRDIKLRSYYISVPLTAKFFVTRGLFLNAGPQFDFLVGERFGNDRITIKPLNNLYKKSVISGLVGIGYQFGFGLGVAFNYNIGFTNALDDAAKDLFTELKNPKSQNLSLIFSFRF